MGQMATLIEISSRHDAEVRELKAEIARLRKRHAEIVGELYGQGLEVAGWHLNGDLEPLDSWFEQNNWLEAVSEAPPERS